MVNTDIFHIVLTNNQGKVWNQVGYSAVKGFAYLNGTLLTDSSLLECIVNALQSDNLGSILNALNGNFSCVVKNEEKLYLISDKIRSYPLIFGNKKSGEWLVSDTEEPFMNSSDFIENKNDVSVAEFYSMGFVSGNNTLLAGVQTVDCGEYVEIGKEGSFRTIEYFKYPRPKKKFIKEQHIESAYKSLESSFARTINSIENNRQILIPLSGGYDSRLIACLCKKYGLSNVVCYTYGRRNSFEVSVSKKVADALGYEWHFVEYTADRFEETLKSERYEQFSNFSCNLNTISHVQDFMAVKKLREEGVIEEGAVVIPGFCGDLFGGSKVPQEVFDWHPNNYNLKNISELIYHHFYDLNVLTTEWRNKVLDRIKEELEVNDVADEESLLDYYEQWCIHNRLAKYIINSLRVYEFFGMDWRMPLWDDEYSQVWYEVPWRNKSAQLLADFMFSRYFRDFAVYYKKADVIRSEKTAVKLLKIILPKRIRLFIRRAYVVMTSANGKRDENCFKATAENISHTCKIGDYKGMVKSWNKANIRAVVSRLEAGKFLSM